MSTGRSLFLSQNPLCLLVIQMLLFLTILVGMYTFGTGYFPRKVPLQGFASWEDSADHNEVGYSFFACLTNQKKPVFTRLVLVVIDALRMDFVFSEDSGMDYVKSLITKKHAFGYNAHADSPTVTLPRIKVCCASKRIIAKFV